MRWSPTSVHPSSVPWSYLDNKLSYLKSNLIYLLNILFANSNARWIKWDVFREHGIEGEKEENKISHRQHRPIAWKLISFAAL